GCENGVDIGLDQMARGVETNHRNDGRMRLMVLREGLRTNEDKGLVARMSGTLVRVDQVEVDSVPLEMIEVRDAVVRRPRSALRRRYKIDRSGGAPPGRRVFAGPAGSPVGPLVADKRVVATAAGWGFFHVFAVFFVVPLPADGILDVAMQVALKDLCV